MTAKELDETYLLTAAEDYRVAIFEGKQSFTKEDVEKAWADGAKWGHNAAHYPASANALDRQSST